MSVFFSQLARYLAVDFIGSFLAFPVWWYGEGFMTLLRLTGRVLVFRAKSYSFALWVKNLLVPMYGQYDLAGRAVSMFMRIVVLIGRGIAYAAEALGYVILLAAWVLAPLLALFGIIWNLAALARPGF